MMNSRPKPTPARPAAVALLCLALTAGFPLPADGQGAGKAPSTKSAGSPAKAGIDVPKIKYTRFVLANGLTVLLHEDHSSPIVATDLWYHVGSKNDVSGRTGLAHLFEHMLDEGSANLPAGEHRRIIQASGGVYNATANEDRTSYWTRVPSNELETVLWLESERMAFLTLDSTRFDLEREAVRNEYRQIGPAAPAAAGGGILGLEAFFGQMFANTIYGNPLFGHMSELGAATMADLRAYYKKYYVPNNAVLAIAGDFDSADVKKKVERYFGGIPRGEAVKQPTAPIPPLTGEQRIVLEDRVAPTRQLWIGWRGVSAAHSDRIPLVALMSILRARLHRTLVMERRIASQLHPVFNAHFDFERSGIFHAVVNATGSMTEIEGVVDSVISSIKTDGVLAQEVDRWVAGFSTAALVQMQSDTAKARRLADGEMIQQKANALFVEVDAARRLTPQEIQRVARKYMVPQRVVMSIVPAGKLDLISKPAEKYTNVTPRQIP